MTLRLSFASQARWKSLLWSVNLEVPWPGADPRWFWWPLTTTKRKLNLNRVWASKFTINFSGVPGIDENVQLDFEPNLSWTTAGVCLRRWCIDQLNPTTFCKGQSFLCSMYSQVWQNERSEFNQTKQKLLSQITGQRLFSLFPNVDQILKSYIPLDFFLLFNQMMCLSYWAALMFRSSFFLFHSPFLCRDLLNLPFLKSSSKSNSFCELRVKLKYF